MSVRRGPYGGQDPNLLGNPLLAGNLANSLADSLGLTQGLAAAPPSQSLPSGLPNGLPVSGGGLGFNMGLPNGGGRHHMDSLSAVSRHAAVCQCLLLLCCHAPKVDMIFLNAMHNSQKACTCLVQRHRDHSF
jgi:hypothetical protein